MLRVKIKYKVVMIQYLKEKDAFITWKKLGISATLESSLAICEKLRMCSPYNLTLI